MKHMFQTMVSTSSHLEPLDSLHIDGDPQARPLQRNSQGPVLAKPEPVINLLLSRQDPIPIIISILNNYTYLNSWSRSRESLRGL